MKNKFFSTSELEVIKEKKKEVKQLNKEDIAIVGISGRFASTHNLEEFWELLKLGRSDIRPFPKERLQKIECEMVGLNPENIIPAGYMDNIDTFDYEFFGLSKRESNTIDPNQRILLEMIWEALEEAGYGGNIIRGTKTGVFIGFSCDHKMDFCNYLKQTKAVDEDEISLAGNVRSVLGSRIAYILDLKGPSVVIDTACSSALASVHLACNSIQQGESDMAIVGGINIDILPVKRGLDDIVGIRSTENRIRAFDEKADGIASGEGAGVIILKPLEKAIEDKDHIHAVIKGSAINQDGSSIGLTAPNARAQTEVMIKAWQMAKIDPSTISYIEAHGTGTKLGDPIEVDGITHAFRQYTDRKSFCALGSLKTNIGHLDGAAGIASILKAILMLKHKKLVASLHFMRANQKIDFVNSPIYISDQCIPWKSEGPRRCGINAFGLSGTNCHVVLEEYIQPEKVLSVESSIGICTISAKDKEGVIKLAQQYLSKINQELQKEDIKDICYTSNMGREHLACRLGVVVGSHEELKKGLEAFLEGKDEGIDYFYGSNKNNQQSEIVDMVINYEGLNERSLQSQREIYKQICKFYVMGGTPCWQKLYLDKGKKVSLPTYPFKKIVCWPKPKKQMRTHSITEGFSLLNGKSIVTMNQIIYTCYLDTSNWVIGEHFVNGKCVLPGTAYIEILAEIQKQMGLWKNGMKIKKLMFMNQFALKQGEEKELQVLLENKHKGYSFKIISHSEDQTWTIHAEGELELLQTPVQVEVESLQALLSRRREKVNFNQDNKVVKIGPHWTNIEKEVYKLDDGYMVYFALDKAYETEARRYLYYPSLMDRCINATIDFLKEDSYFLPFNYEKLVLLKPLPTALYSVVKVKAYKGEEVVVLDVNLYDLQGQLIGQAINYSVKRIHDRHENHMMSMKLIWEKVQNESVSKTIPKKLAVIGCVNKVKEFIDICKAKGVLQIIPIYLKSDMTETDLIEAVNQINTMEVADIVYWGREEHHLENKSMIEVDKKLTLDSLFLLLHHLIRSKLTRKINILVVLNHAYKILEEDQMINPYHTSLGALAKVVTQEEPKLLVKVIDIDHINTHEIIFNELCQNWDILKIGYRDNIRYKENFKHIEYNEDITHKEIYKNYKQEGIYLITGGTGEIGKALAKHLIAQGVMNVALLSRHAKQKEEEIALELEKPGTHVQFVDVDLGDYEALKKALNKLRDEYGCINGVFHCAGIVSKGIIVTESQKAFHEVLRSKVEGTIYLDLLTSEDCLDFMVYFSSINALTGGIGQGDYAAANAFLDGYSLYRNNKGYKTISINWPGWKDIGMAKRHNAFKADDLLEGIYSKEALPCIERVLVRDEAQIIVGNMRQQEKQLKEQENNLDSNLTSTENKIAQIWKDVLEIEEVDIFETFSSLGGDSIMANYLYKQLEQQFPGMVDITDVFSYPTIKEMAQFIDSQENRDANGTTNEMKGLNVNEGEKEIDDLLSRLARGEISVDELL